MPIPIRAQLRDATRLASPAQLAAGVRAVLDRCDDYTGETTGVQFADAVRGDLLTALIAPDLGQVPDGDDTDPADSNWYENAEYRYGPPSAAAWARAQALMAAAVQNTSYDSADHMEQDLNRAAEFIITGSYPRPPAQ